jgi:hypothetical protein
MTSNPCFRVPFLPCFMPCIMVAMCAMCAMMAPADEAAMKRAWQVYRQALVEAERPHYAAAGV